MARGVVWEIRDFMHWAAKPKPAGPRGPGGLGFVVLGYAMASWVRDSDFIDARGEGIGASYGGPQHAACLGTVPEEGLAARSLYFSWRIHRSP